MLSMYGHARMNIGACRRAAMARMPTLYAVAASPEAKRKP